MSIIKILFFGLILFLIIAVLSYAIYIISINKPCKNKSKLSIIKCIADNTVTMSVLNNSVDTYDDDKFLEEYKRRLNSDPVIERVLLNNGKDEVYHG
ncbi:MAG: hypothetical protein ACI3T9_06860 [Romboutsia timonensis]